MPIRILPGQANEWSVVRRPLWLVSALGLCTPFTAGPQNARPPHEPSKPVAEACHSKPSPRKYDRSSPTIFFISHHSVCTSGYSQALHRAHTLFGQNRLIIGSDSCITCCSLLYCHLSAPTSRLSYSFCFRYVLPLYTYTQICLTVSQLFCHLDTGLHLSQASA